MVVLPDGGALRVDENSVVNIAEPPAGGTLIELLRGLIHIISRDPRSLTFRTPYANAGLEGTEFDIRVDDEERFTEIVVLEGDVVVTAPAGELNVPNNYVAIARDGSAFNLDFVSPLTTHLAWDLRLGIDRLDGQPGLPDTDVWKLGANLKWTFNPAAPLRVFVNGGPHLYHFDPGTFEGGANLGLGLQVPAGPRFAVEATYNYHWALTPSPDLEVSELQLGTLVSF